MIRPYETADGPQVLRIHNAVFPDQKFTTRSLADYVTGTRAIGGLVWVIGKPSLVGYGVVAPVPGLPGIAELAGCIAPEQQRQGIGSLLLQGIANNLHDSDIRQITYSVESLDVPAALFLLRHNFFVEHEEWLLRFDNMAKLPESSWPNGVKLQTYPRKTAVALFCELYEQSFSGLPWDQPFTHMEVIDTLDSAEDLLFLISGGEAIGLAWIRRDSEEIAIVEPLAVLPAYQNQGYGRCLLTEAMHVLAQRGARQIEIGAWCDNVRAIELYRSLGFRRHKTITFLAYDLPM